MLAALWLMTGLAVPEVLGEAPEYLIDVWDTENTDNELPNSSVTAIAQTPDGYLWIGTYNGLARFDGKRFMTFDPAKTPALGHARIQGLYVDAEGTLWINTYRGGLTSCRNLVFSREWEGRGEFDLKTTLATSSTNRAVFVTQSGEVLLREGPSGTNGIWTELNAAGTNRLVFHCEDAEGRGWFLTRDGRVMRLAGRRFEEIPAVQGLLGTKVLTLASDPQGRVWAGTDHEVARWDGARFQTMYPTNALALEAAFILPTQDGGVWILSAGRFRKLLGGRWVLEAKEWRGLLGYASGRAMGSHQDRSGGIWLNHYGNGLFHVTADGQFQRFTTADGLPGDRVWAWLEGREGDIWLGVDRGGLARLRERRFQVIGPASGLSGPAAFSVCESPAGTVWLGTSGGGLSRWQGGELANYPIGTDASDNLVFSIFPRKSGGLWLSASAGEDLYEFRDDRVQKSAWEAHGIKTLLEDRQGRLWMGTKIGLGWISADKRRSFTSRDGLVVSAVRTLIEAKDGSVWGGADDGTLYRCDPDRLTAFRPTDAPAGQPIWALMADSDNTIWAGTFRGGLLRFKNGKFARLTSDQGLPGDVISQILSDTQGQMWLGTHQGICRVSRAAIEACLGGRAERVDCVTYGRLDGLPSLECSGGYQPAGWRAADGRLWFATVKGVVSVKPDELRMNPVPPPVEIEDWRVDGERFPMGAGAARVPPGRKQYDFRYTALSFIAPDKVRFRYRLEGLEKEWVEAGGRRLANYSHLPAGDYVFRVIACNNDGVWNERGRALAFSVAPFFYHTWWFYLLTALATFGAVAATVRNITSRKYRAALSHLEQQHAIERDRARIAKDIHDDLGAGLTQITLLTELARRDPPGQVAIHLDRISDAARKMTRAMDEIVWAVDPQHDSLSGLMDYISAFTEEFLRVAGIRCRMDLPEALPAAPVAAETRYNLFLALKEALNNVVKHARATEVWLRLRLEPGEITLVIEDNGQGLAPNGGGGGAARLMSGHGLTNLRKRLETVGGRCRVDSTAGKGTRVDLTVPARVETSPIVATGKPGADGAG